MKKKLLSLCMTLAIVLMLLSADVMAQSDFNIVNGNLISYNGTGGDVQIPSDVTEIGNTAFSNRTNLTSVTIPDGVVDIGNYSFKGCSGLTEIRIPDSVTRINEGAFSYCTSLSTVVLPENIDTIGHSNFAGCNSLTTIEIPDSITSIGTKAFCDCINLANICIPGKVTVIGKSAFQHCKNITALDLPDSVTNIDAWAFRGTGLTQIIIPNNVTSIGSGAFAECLNLTDITISSSVKDIGGGAFEGCKKLKNFIIPNGVTRIGTDTFSGCSKLKQIYIPNSVTFIDERAFWDCGLTHVFYSGSKEQWNQIKGHGIPHDANIHYNSVMPVTNNSIAQTQNKEDEYIYNVEDPGENVKFPTDILDRVTDSKSAVDAVDQMTNNMTSEQKSSPTGIDLATLYAETAVSKAASKEVEGEVIISADSVADVEAAAKQAASTVETALVNGGVTTARYLSKTVTLTTDETGEITIKIDPDILTTEVDKIRVETPGYALTLKTADLAEDLTKVLTITAEEVGSGFAPGKANRKVTVKVTLPKGRTTNPVTVSLPADKGATTYQAVVKIDGSATSSKYNPATTTMDGKVNTSGTYTVQTNEKSFTDISNKSAEMQKAILYLTSKGIINGTSATTFSPNGTINRQQVAALLMRALGKVDNSATVTFKDVSTQSSLYHEIASSKKHKIVNGYSDNTFRGTNVISRAQIVTVAGRVLTSEMNYKAPSNASTYLAKYSDTVPDFAKEMVALATRENLVVYRTDGTFSGGKNMTRGDAAIILYRLFQRIW